MIRLRRPEEAGGCDHSMDRGLGSSLSWLRVPGLSKMSDEVGGQTILSSVSLNLVDAFVMPSQFLGSLGTQSNAFVVRLYDY